MGRTLVIGDIHGAYEAMLQVMERSDFDREKDRLICMGDVADRRPHVKECTALLLQVKDLVMILGNHDKWAMEWMSRVGEQMWNAGDSDSSAAGKTLRKSFDVNDLYETASEVWLTQGGSDTIVSYSEGVPPEHFELLRQAKYYHIEGNRVFVHGGFNHRKPLDGQDPEDFLWDRSLVDFALKHCESGTRLGGFDEIYVGHTPTINIHVSASGRSALKGAVMEDQTTRPLQVCNVWMMDTGAGWPGGKLSMMDIDTKEIWQSDAIE